MNLHSKGPPQCESHKALERFLPWRLMTSTKHGQKRRQQLISSTYNRIAMYTLLVGLDNVQEMAWKSCNWSSVIHFPGKHQETQIDVKGQFCSDGLSLLKDIINSNDSVIQLNGLANSATRKLEEDRHNESRSPKLCLLLSVIIHTCVHVPRSWFQPA